MCAKIFTSTEMDDLHLSGISSENIVFSEIKKAAKMISDASIKDMVRDMIARSPKNFSFDGVLSTRTISPPENRMSNGILIHTIKSIQIAKDLAAFYNTSSEDNEIIIASLLLRDIHKNGIPWGDSEHEEHGMICSKKLDKYGEVEEYKMRMIKTNIETHMARWARPYDCVASSMFPTNQQVIVQVADYMSDVRDLSFYPDKSIITLYGNGITEKLSSDCHRQCKEIVKKIRSADIRNFVVKAFKSSPKGFWTAPSSTNNYHPPENNIVRGLVVHTIKTYYCAMNLCDLFGVYNYTERDIIMASCLLHDLYKHGIDWNGYDKKHGPLCAKVIDKIELDKYKKTLIKMCISNHMSQWNEPVHSLVKGYNADRMALIVQLSDYIASRKAVSFYPGISVSKMFE